VQVDSARPRSVLANLLVYRGDPFLSVTLAPFKRWHRVALRESRVLLYLDGELYERRIRLV